MLVKFCEFVEFVVEVINVSLCYVLFLYVVVGSFDCGFGIGCCCDVF